MSGTPVYAITIIFEMLVVFYYFEHYLPPVKKSLLHKLSMFIVSYFLLFCVSLQYNATFNALAFLIVNTFLCLVVYNTKLKTGIFSSMFISMVMGASELAAVFIIQPLMPTFSSPDLADHSTLICFFISKLLFLFIVTFLCHRKDSKKISFSNIHVIVIMLLSVILYSIISYIGCSYKLTETTSTLISVAFICILLINLFMFLQREYTQTQQNQIDEIKHQLHQEYLSNQYYGIIENQRSSERILIHDIKKHLSIVQNMLSTSSPEEIDNYIQELLNSPALSKIINYTSYKNMNIILSYYQTKCQEKGINFLINVSDIDLNFISFNDMTTIMCNILDNAIEAVEQCEDKWITLDLKCNDNSSCVLITVKNICSSPPKYDSQGELITTKKKSETHGLGILSVKKAIEHYDGFLDTYYEATLNEFCLHILLQNKEEDQ